MDTIGKRIRSARIMRDMTQQGLASKLGISRVSVTQWENDQTKPESDKYEKIADILGGSADFYLTGGGVVPVSDRLLEHMRREVAPPRTAPNASFPPQYQKFTDSSLPLLGQTIGGPNGRFLLNGSEVSRVFTPPMLEGVEGAYAVRVYGTSMEPRYYAGETVWLNPHEPVRQGDDVVVQLLTDEENGRESYIKRFMSQSSKVTRLWQHNPDEGEQNELTFDTERVFSIHKIVFHATV
jgi:phage repressor protein C with HTH and peptisase S24 domain